jgi:hypothetical protein
MNCNRDPKSLAENPRADHAPTPLISDDAIVDILAHLLAQSALAKLKSQSKDDDEHHQNP